MNTKEGLPSWQWADYGRLNAAVSKSAQPMVNIPENKDFGSDVVNQEPPKYISFLFRDDFGELAPDNIDFYREAARRGINFFLSSLFEHARQKDLRLGGIMQTRKLSILSKPFTIKVEKWNEGKQEVEKMFAHLGEKLYNFFTDIIEAQIQGCKFFELNYIRKDSKIYIDSITGIANSLYLYDSKTKEYSLMDTTKQNVHEIRAKAIQNIYEDVANIPKQEIHPMKLLKVFSLDGDNENAFVNGVRIAIVQNFFYKNYNIKDLQIYIERFASPLIHISYDSVNEKVKNQASSIAKNLKAHGYAITPKDALTIAFIESQTKQSTSDIFLKSMEYIDTESSTRVLGEADTSNKMGANGSRAAMQVKKTVRDDITTADLKLIISTCNELIRRWCDMNFTSISEYPTMHFIDTKSLEDKLKLSEILMNLSNGGYKINDPKELQEMFDFENVEISAPAAPGNNGNKKTTDAGTKAAQHNQPFQLDDVDLYIQKIKEGK